jgi:hypothetical protein
VNDKRRISKEILERRGIRLQSTYLEFGRSLASQRLLVPREISFEEYDGQTWIVWRTHYLGDSASFKEVNIEHKRVGKFSSTCFDEFLRLADAFRLPFPDYVKPFRVFVNKYGPLGIWPFIVDARKDNDEVNESYNVSEVGTDYENPIDNTSFIVYREPIRLYFDLAVECRNIIFGVADKV